MTDTTPEPSFLITTQDTLTQDDAAQLRNDIHITPRPLPLGLTAGMTPTAVSTALAEALEQLLNSRIFCTACAFAAHKAGGLNSAVQLNIANVIADGNGLCFAHVQFADVPGVQVQTAGGIIIPGAGA